MDHARSKGGEISGDICTFGGFLGPEGFFYDVIFGRHSEVS